MSAPPRLTKPGLKKLGKALWKGWNLSWMLVDEQDSDKQEEGKGYESIRNGCECGGRGGVVGERGGGVKVYSQGDS